MFEALANPPAPSYQSVKLPAALVSAAKASAQTFRRSTSGQIEYWATLGKSLESKGLTTLQAKEAVEQSDHAQQLQSWVSKIKTVSQNGELAAAIQSTLKADKRRATKAV